MPIRRLIAKARRAAALLMLAAALGCPSPPPPLAEAEGDLRALVARYDSAWNAKDSATVARILAPSYAYFTSSARLSDRDASLGFLADTGYVLDSTRRSEIRIVVDGPVARVASRWEGHGRFQGRPVRDDQTCGQTWVWSRRAWRLFTEHCVNRPAADSAPALP